MGDDAKIANHLWRGIAWNGQNQVLWAGYGRSLPRTAPNWRVGQDTRYSSPRLDTRNEKTQWQTSSPKRSVTSRTKSLASEIRLFVQRCELLFAKLAKLFRLETRLKPSSKHRLRVGNSIVQYQRVSFTRTMRLTASLVSINSSTLSSN